MATTTHRGIGRISDSRSYFSSKTPPIEHTELLARPMLRLATIQTWLMSVDSVARRVNVGETCANRLSGVEKWCSMVGRSRSGPGRLSLGSTGKCELSHQ